MLKIEGKTFMNIQEAVQWLLDNNALPFQSSANYVANTEIGLGTIVNPSPAKVRIGSLIFFADSKVSTVVGITETGFICSDQYNNLVDDIAYVTNVSINASGHLITTLSDGQTIDAGIIKQVNNFSIDASQHLIANYNDGTSTDLGAIFSGNITVSGNLTVTGGISGNAITGDSIIENMSGYSFSTNARTNLTKEMVYAGACKNGNKLTLVVACNFTRTGEITDGSPDFIFNIPSSVGQKLYNTTVGAVTTVLATGEANFTKSIASTDGHFNYYVSKASDTTINVFLYGGSTLTLNEKVYCRMEWTFLLSDSLAS